MTGLVFIPKRLMAELHLLLRKFLHEQITDIAVQY